MIDLDSDKAAVLLKHLAIASKKFKKRDKAHSNLHKHLKKVRKVVTTRNKKKAVNNAMDKLEKHIGEALEMEKQLLSRQSFEMAYGELIKKEIERLKEPDIKLTRKPVKKILKAPRKAKKPVKNTALEKKIKDLELKFNKMKKMQNYDKEVIKRVKDKINELKKKI